MNKINWRVVFSFLVIAITVWGLTTQYRYVIIQKKGLIIQATLIKTPETYSMRAGQPICTFKYNNIEFTSKVSENYWQNTRIGATADFYYYDKYPDKFINAGKSSFSIYSNLFFLTLFMVIALAYLIKTII